mgnify:CR=1 FL=1
MNVLLQPANVINERFELPLEQLQYKSDNGNVTNIDVPDAYLGNAPLYVRLLCSVKRQGMVRKPKT